MLQYKFIVMPQEIDKNSKKVEKHSIGKISEKAKTKFQEEWENGISVEELRTNLLKKVHTRWNEKLASAKK
jgi:hypothetical protein